MESFYSHCTPFYTFASREQPGGIQCLVKPNNVYVPLDRKLSEEMMTEKVPVNKDIQAATLDSVAEFPDTLNLSGKERNYGIDELLSLKYGLYFFCIVIFAVLILFYLQLQLRYYYGDY